MCASSVKLLIVLAVITTAFSGVLHSDRKLSEGLCDPSVNSYSGYYSTDDKLLDKNYFYWLFESRSNPSTDPLIIWLTGGPGCSSSIALFTENGPCTINSDGASTSSNPFSWNSNANIMYIDQPASVGYSYGVINTHNESMIADDMYNFLQHFFKKYANFRSNEFFVFGESYGGHYVPAIGNRIYSGNAAGEGLHINLKGVGMGNGHTKTSVQYQYYPTMAMNNSYGLKTVSEEVYADMLSKMPKCMDLTAACNANDTLCGEAYWYCNAALVKPFQDTGLDTHDIRKQCEGPDHCDDFSLLSSYLNLDSTRQALGVSEKVSQWEACNDNIKHLFDHDLMKDMDTLLIPLLENDIRVLAYSGDADYICNWYGNKAWTLLLPWSGSSSFNAAADVNWTYTSTSGAPAAEGVVVAGEIRSATAASGSGSLTFLRVFDAGHMVPRDQPEAALKMLNAFTANQL